MDSKKDCFKMKQDVKNTSHSETHLLFLLTNVNGVNTILKYE